MNTQELGELQKSLIRARGLLWKLIQQGGFKEPALALAAVDAYKAADKALKLTLEELSQLPLEKGSE